MITQYIPDIKHFSNNSKDNTTTDDCICNKLGYMPYYINKARLLEGVFQTDAIPHPCYTMSAIVDQVLYDVLDRGEHHNCIRFPVGNTLTKSNDSIMQSLINFSNDLIKLGNGIAKKIF